MSGFNFNEVFGPKATPKPKRKPIVYHNIKAPDINSTTPESYVRFELVPQYNGLTQYYEGKDLHLKIILIDGITVNEKFFAEVDEILKKEGTSLRGRYELVKKV